MAQKPIVFYLDVKPSEGFKPKKGSKYVFTLGEQYLELTANYGSVVDVGTPELPDYVNRKIFFNYSVYRGSLATVGISTHEVDPETQKNTYSFQLNDIDCYYFEEEELPKFIEIQDKIKKWNVIS